MTTRTSSPAAAIEWILVEEAYPEGRVAATVPMRRNPRTGELSYTASAIHRLDRLRAMLVEMTGQSTPGHIRMLRDALGLTQQQFAQRLEVTGQTVSRWERGEVRPNADAIARLQGLQSAARKKGIAVKPRSHNDRPAPPR